MRISRKTDYALRTLLDLALHDKQVVPGAQIASRREIPIKFLEQILLILKGAGIVASRRGKNGGYLLAERPSRITLASVVRLSEGSLSIAPNPRRSTGQRTTADVEASLDEVWAGIDDYIAGRLQQVTLQDMCDRVAEISRQRQTQYVI